MASSGLLPAGCKSKDNVTPAISLQLPYSPTTHQARVLCDFRAIPCLLKYSFRHHLFLVLFRTNKAQITQGNCPNWDFFGMCSKISPPPYDYDDFGCLYTPGQGSSFSDLVKVFQYWFCLCRKIQSGVKTRCIGRAHSAVQVIIGPLTKFSPPPAMVNGEARALS